MVGHRRSESGWRGSRGRVVFWATGLGLWLLPAVAMCFTREVAWGPGDFALFGALLFAPCGAYDLAANRTDSLLYRAAAGIAVMVAFFHLWLSLAVGIFGNEGDPLNALCGGVIALGLLGAFLTRFQPQGLARVMSGMAIAQLLVAAIGQAAGRNPIWVLTGFSTVLWLTSAWLFREAARERVPPGAAPTR